MLAALKWWKLVTDQSVCVRGAGSDETLNILSRSTDGDLVIVSLAGSAPVSVDLRSIAAAVVVRATRVNPENGAESSVGEFSHNNIQQFGAPGGASDAVLILRAK